MYTSEELMQEKLHSDIEHPKDVPTVNEAENEDSAEESSDLPNTKNRSSSLYMPVAEKLTW
jgi:hypothetical protein